MKDSRKDLEILYLKEVIRKSVKACQMVMKDLESALQKGDNTLILKKQKLFRLTRNCLAEYEKKLSFLLTG